MPSQKTTSPVRDALMILFSRSPRQMEILKGIEQPQPKYGLSDSIENRLTQVFVGYADVSNDRVTKYRDFDKMDMESTECQTALDIFAEEAAQVDSKTQMRIWVTSQDQKIADELNGMFQRMNLEAKAYGIYRNIAKYGDCFMYLLLGGYGVHDMYFVHPSRVERVQDDGLLGFKSMDLSTLVQVDNKNYMFKPWDFCADSATEILTETRGWVLFKDLLPTDKVATRNPSTKTLEWQQPTNYVNSPYKGEMYKIKSSSVDMVVTPNHRMLVTKGSSKEEVFMTAEEIFASNKYQSYYHIPMTSSWVGTEVTEKIFVHMYKGVGRHSSPLTMSGDDYVAFMGMYLSEGHALYGGDINIGQQSISKGYEPYKILLERIFERPITHNGESFSFSKVALGEFLCSFGLSENKYIPQDIMNATPRQLQIFWDYYMLGDGSLHKRPTKTTRTVGNRNGVYTSIHTTSKVLAGQLQEIAQKLGLSASVWTRPAYTKTRKKDGKTFECKESYAVAVRHKTGMSFKITKEQYDGTVHCVTVPNSTIYVRRNGKPAWTGNCHFRILAYDRENVYGRSILESLRKVWKQLSMLECFDEKTEVLTKDRGWIYFKDVMDTDQIATRNPDTKNFEWQLPTEIVKRPHTGDMIELKGKSIDLLVTPDHRVLLDKLPIGSLEGPIENYAKEEVVIRAEELVNNSKGVSMPNMSGWDGGIEIIEKVFPSIPNEVDHSRPIDSLGRPAQKLHFTTKGSQERIIGGDDFCALMGMFLAEGCVNNKRHLPNRSGGLRIAQQAESKGYEAYKEVLTRIHGGVAVPYDGHAFHLNWRVLNPYFEQFGLAADKFIPEEILNAPQRQLKIFFDFYVLGDGYFEKDLVKEGVYAGERRVSITTVSKRLAEQLVEVIQKLGYGVSIYTVPEREIQFKDKKAISKCREAYTIRVRYSKSNYFSAKRVAYDGMVYCVHVPNKFVYVRRNNKMVFSGQTMIVLYRIAKSVQRNIFYVDVGQASGPETTQILKEYEKFLKNKTSFVDPRTKEFRLDFNPATMLQDIVWPTRQNSPSKVEYLQNTNQIGPLEDLEYFRNKIRSGLGIPRDYFDGETTGAWNAREALQLQDVRFSRKVKKLQDAMKDGIVRVCQIHYAITHGEYLDAKMIQVNMGTISDNADRMREDIIIRKGQGLMLLAAVADSMGWNKQVWSDYLLDQIFPLPPELRDKLFTPDPTTLLASQEGIHTIKSIQASGVDPAAVVGLIGGSSKGKAGSYVSKRGQGSFMSPGGKLSQAGGGMGEDIIVPSTTQPLTEDENKMIQESAARIKARLTEVAGTTSTTWKKSVKWDELLDMSHPSELKEN